MTDLDTARLNLMLAQNEVRGILQGDRDEARLSEVRPRYEAATFRYVELVMKGRP